MKLLLGKNIQINLKSVYPNNFSPHVIMSNIIECSVNNECQQICINIIGNYHCGCQAGYEHAVVSFPVWVSKQVFNTTNINSLIILCYT